MAAMRPGVRGWDVDAAQREVLSRHGSIPIIWSTGHPVGYWAWTDGGGVRHTKWKVARPFAPQVQQARGTDADAGHLRSLAGRARQQGTRLEDCRALIQSAVDAAMAE